MLTGAMLGKGRRQVSTYRKYWIPIGLASAAIAVATLTPAQLSQAADHLDPPGRTDPAVDATADTPADIADVYSWHTADSVVIAVTFAGPQPTTAPAFYDRNMLYTVNISNAGTRADVEIPIQVRFGPGANANEFGVQVTGLPGVTGALVGPVETNLTSNGVTFRAGLFDDPFFFDLVGFRQTVSTGTLAFDNQRNFFAGQNLTAIVMEIPRSRIENGTNPIGIWASTARFGGQL